MFKLVRMYAFEGYDVCTYLTDIARALNFVLGYMDIDIDISDEAHNGYYYLLVAHEELTENEIEKLLIAVHTYVYARNWTHCVEYTDDGLYWQNVIDP